MKKFFVFRHHSSPVTGTSTSGKDFKHDRAAVESWAKSIDLLLADKCQYHLIIIVISIIIVMYISPLFHVNTGQTV